MIQIGSNRMATHETLTRRSGAADRAKVIPQSKPTAVRLLRRSSLDGPERLSVWAQVARRGPRAMVLNIERHTDSSPWPTHSNTSLARAGNSEELPCSVGVVFVAGAIRRSPSADCTGSNTSGVGSRNRDYQSTRPPAPSPDPDLDPTIRHRRANRHHGRRYTRHHRGHRCTHHHGHRLVTGQPQATPG